SLGARKLQLKTGSTTSTTYPTNSARLRTKTRRSTGHEARAQHGTRSSSPSAITSAPAVRCARNLPLLGAQGKACVRDPSVTVSSTDAACYDRSRAVQLRGKNVALRVELARSKLLNGRQLLARSLRPAKAGFVADSGLSASARNHGSP